MLVHAYFIALFFSFIRSTENFLNSTRIKVLTSAIAAATTVAKNEIQ